MLFLTPDNQMDSRVLSIAGKQLFVDVLGLPLSPSTPVLLLLHGLGSNSTFYQAIITLSNLTLTHTIVRYDMDGHGLSPSSNAEITIDGLTDDLYQIIKHFKLDKVSLVAHSMQGGVALRYASKYPKAVTKLCA